MADYIKISLLGEVFLALWIDYIPKTKAIGVFLMAFVMGITQKNFYKKEFLLCQENLQKPKYRRP